MKFSLDPLEGRALLAATYYVSATGNDSADGRTTQTAWKTIARVNAKDFAPGDRVLFQGGKSFTVAGSAGANVIANGGFESNLSAWADTQGTAAAGATLSKTSGLYHSGASAIRLSGSGDVVRAQNITSKLKPNQAYLMSAWTKTFEPRIGDRRVGVTFTLGGKEVGTFFRGFRSTTWAQTQWEFVAPPKFDKAVAWVLKKGDNSTFYIDDVSLKSIPNGLVFDASDSGTSAAPVTVGSYGTGRATIDAKDGIGLWGGNVAGFSVQNINFAGSWNASTGSGNNVGVGVELVNTLDDDIKLNYIRIANVDAHGFRWAGIQISGWKGKSGFRDVRVTDSSLHHNGDAGLQIGGDFSRISTAYSIENLYVARIQAYYNTGIPNKGGNSGNGILVADTLGGVIERSVAHHNGSLNNATEGGPVGIWAFDASKITIQYNESYANKTGSTKDGGGFDLDGGVTDSVMQYNYSHDNDGPGFLLCTFTGARAWGRNTVRYNISQNDARRNNYGAVTFTGGSAIANSIVENNTIYLTKPTNGTNPSGVRVTSAGSGVHVRNNIIQTAGGATLVHSDSKTTPVQFHGNDYWSSGASFRIEWGGSVYGSLSSWRSASGSEKNGTTATGMSVDPKLSGAGSAPTLGDASKLSTLTHYKLKSGSPVINLSQALASPFTGYTAATKDFFGKSFTTRRDLGSAEYV